MGIEKSPFIIDIGMDFLRQAANQGYPSAQFELGYCYENGYCVRKDRAEAIRLYQLAAAQGETNAQERISELGLPKTESLDSKNKNDGKRYATQLGDARSLPQHLPVPEEKGEDNPEAMTRTAHRLLNTGTSANEELALHLLHSAAEKGYADAQYALGVCYQYGIGVKKDRDIALRIYKSASSSPSSTSSTATTTVSSSAPETPEVPSLTSPPS